MADDSESLIQTNLPDEWSTVKTSIVDRIAPTREESGLTLMDGPLQWVTFGRVLIGTLLSAMIVGINVSIDAMFSLLVRPFEGLASFADDLVTTLVGIPSGVLDTAATTTTVAITGLNEVLLESFSTLGWANSPNWVISVATSGGLGVLAWPIGVAVVLVSLYVAARGVREVLG